MKAVALALFLLSPIVGATAAYSVYQYIRRDAPLMCSIDALPKIATTADVMHLCGIPYTSNTSFADGVRLDEWVFDAGTFLWFRDGILSFSKVDQRHVPEQESMAHTRHPFDNR